MTELAIMHLEPSACKKFWCAPCVVQQVEGCSDAAVCCWISCFLAWPISGLVATFYTTQPVLQSNFNSSVQQGYIFPPDEHQKRVIR
ncbi:hypothetical protein DIPPA_15083 [Diplonema papillatum]|nr:hypothetical protein DIPPA_15083 [Diplonema papillatum]